jgi:D-lactate dehydrogenase (cytochrome)
VNTITARPVDAVIAAAREFLGERLSTAQAVREQHGRGEDQTPPTLPDAVAFAETTEEVSRIVALCHQHGVAVTPFGAGTSLEGHVNPVRRGITLDLSRMTAIHEVNPEDMDCLIEPGVTRHQLNDFLRDQGLFFPVDPGSHCTIGGMCATRASGTNAVRYGTIRENVLGLQVVLADGRVIETGGRARKAANGYDLTRLMIGSEGTLGVITRVRLRLHGIPEAMSSAVCQFPDLKSAVETVIATSQSGIPVARMELLDAAMMEACVRYSKLEGYKPATTLFLEFHGSHAGVAEQAASVEAIAVENGGEGFAWATDAESATACGRRGTTPTGRARAEARLEGAHHRRLRADLPLGRGARRRQGGSGGARPHHLHRRPCRRRQLPPDGALRPDDPEGWSAPGRWTGASWRAAWRWAAPARANTAWAWASASSWNRSTGRRRWR